MHELRAIPLALCLALVSARASTQSEEKQPAQAPIAEPFAIAHELQLAEPATALAWHPKQRYLATLERSGVVTVYDAKTGKVEKTLTGPSSEHGAIAFSGNGKWLAVGGLDQVYVFRIGGWWKRIRKMDLSQVTPDKDDRKHGALSASGCISDVAALQFTRNNQHLLIAGDSPVIESWHTKNWLRHDLIYNRKVHVDDDDSDITGLTLAQKGRLIVTAGRQAKLRVWRKRGRNWQVTELRDEEAKVPEHEGTDVRCSKTGNLIVVGGAQRSGRLQLVDLRGVKRVFDLPVQASYVPAVDFALDGKSVFCASEELTQHSTKDGTTLRRFHLPDVALMLRVSPQGDLLAVSTTDRQVRIFKLEE